MAQRAFHQTPRMMASPTMPNHYETLGVPTDASPTDVKK
jgi:DnaJ-class molecular chaperone